MVRHPLDAYLRKFILIGKEFVLLCKMIEKQQEISSCRSINKVCHIFLLLQLVSKNPEAENGVDSKNWTTEE